MCRIWRTGCAPCILLPRLWLKDDARLPVSGSIKARGGIYEVLLFAEQIALSQNKITTDSDTLYFRILPCGLSLKL